MRESDKTALSADEETTGHRIHIETKLHEDGVRCACYNPVVMLEFLLSVDGQQFLHLPCCRATGL